MEFEEDQMELLFLIFLHPQEMNIEKKASVLQQIKVTLKGKKYEYRKVKINN